MAGAGAGTSSRGLSIGAVALDLGDTARQRRTSRAETQAADAAPTRNPLPTVQWRWRLRRSAITMLLSSMRMSRALYLIRLLAQFALAATTAAIIIVESYEGRGESAKQSRMLSPVALWLIIFMCHQAGGRRPSLSPPAARACEAPPTRPLAPQVICMGLTVWRRLSTLAQLAEGVPLELVEMSMNFSQLHALVVMVGSKVLFISGVLIAMRRPDGSDSDLARIWQEAAVIIVGVSFLLPLLAYYSIALLFPCFLAALATTAPSALDDGRPAASPGGGPSSRGLCMKDLQRLPVFAYRTPTRAEAIRDNRDAESPDNCCCICFNEYRDGDALRRLP